MQFKTSAVNDFQPKLNDYEMSGVTVQQLEERHKYGTLENVTVELCARACLAGSGKRYLIT